MKLLISEMFILLSGAFITIFWAGSAVGDSSMSPNNICWVAILSITGIGCIISSVVLIYERVKGIFRANVSEQLIEDANLESQVTGESVETILHGMEERVGFRIIRPDRSNNHEHI